jgi:hypothetical protein
MYELYQSTVYDLAQQSGFRFQVRNTLSEEDLEPTLRVVIALPPDPGPGIAALAAAAPQAQFLAINIPGLTAGGNISVLANNVQTDIVAFMAGYIGAMITDDYRIGMIYPDGNAEALSALDAYTNGKAYAAASVVATTICLMIFPNLFRSRLRSPRKLWRICGISHPATRSRFYLCVS